MLKSARSMKAWRDTAEHYERTSWKLGTARGEHVRERRLHAAVRILKPNNSVLDVGCGPATLTKDFPCPVVGCDLSVTMLKKAKERIAEVVRCDAQQLPFRDKCFDVSFESSCLYLVGAREAMIREMERVGRKQVIIFESNRLSLRRLYDKYLGGTIMKPEHPSPSEVKRYMETVGLSPRVRMVGFSPLVGGSLLLKLWKPLEWFMESCPGIRCLAGGILASASLKDD